MLSAGDTLAAFRRKCSEALVVSEGVRGLDRILLVDDVITKGATTTCATERLRGIKPDLDIVVAGARFRVLASRIRRAGLVGIGYRVLPSWRNVAAHRRSKIATSAFAAGLSSIPCRVISPAWRTARVPGTSRG